MVATDASDFLLQSFNIGPQSGDYFEKFLTAGLSGHVLMLSHGRTTANDITERDHGAR